MEIDVAVDVAPIIENYAAETALQRNRKSRLRVHDRQHLPANRHANQAARGSISRITAHRYRPLRTRSIHRETAQRIRSAGKKTLTQRHAVSAKRRRKSHTEVIRPSQPRSDRPIERRLP